MNNPSISPAISERMPTPFAASEPAPGSRYLVSRQARLPAGWVDLADTWGALAGLPIAPGQQLAAPAGSDEETALRDFALEWLIKREDYQCAGKTALDLAVTQGHTLAACLLVECDVPSTLIHSRDNRGMNSLMNAIAWHHQDIALALIAAGTDPNLRFARGMTALHAALNLDCHDVALALVEAGADPLALDDEGRTPLDFAKEPVKADLYRVAVACNPLRARDIHDALFVDLRAHPLPADVSLETARITVTDWARRAASTSSSATSSDAHTRSDNSPLATADPAPQTLGADVRRLLDFASLSLRRLVGQDGEPK